MIHKNNKCFIYVLFCENKVHEKLCKIKLWIKNFMKSGKAQIKTLQNRHFL